MALAGFIQAERNLYEQTQSERWRKEHQGRIDLIAVLQVARAIEANVV